MIARFDGLNSIFLISDGSRWMSPRSDEYVTPLRVWWLFGISVWLASQTSRTITMSGKNALRKKRFTGCGLRFEVKGQRSQVEVPASAA